MSVIKKTIGAESLNIRDSAHRFMEAFAAEQRKGYMPQTLTDAALEFEAALLQPERSRPGLIPDVDHALGAIAAMKAGAPIIPDDVKAIVQLAEEGAEQLRAFDLRWNADMRAIKRWQAGEVMPRDVRATLTDAAALLRGYEAHHRAKIVDGYPPKLAAQSLAKAITNRNMAEQIETHLAEAAVGGRELIWPDHADLVVWLLELTTVNWDGPSPADVDQLDARLKGALERRPGDAALMDARGMIARLTLGIETLARRCYALEQTGGAPVPAMPTTLASDHEVRAGFEAESG